MMKLINLLNKILFPVIRLYWFIFRPKTSGAKCVIEHNKKILLVRSNYAKKQWTFPGGSIKKGEKPERTIIREIKEEVGLDVFDLKFLGEFVSEAYYIKDKVYCFSAKTNKKELNLRKYEILEAGWFLPSDIPEPFGEVAKRVKILYEKNKYT